MIPYHFDSMIAIIIAYLFGSVSSAIIVSKLMGLPDPRTEGSKNPGTTNVLRLGGKKAAIITLIGDVLKGVIPVVAARLYGLDTLSIALVAFAAFIGHLYPIFFRFQGGKGVATAFGCLIALNLYIGLSLAATWIIMAYLFRYSSLAAIVASLLAPFYAWYFTNWTYTIAIAVIAAMLIFRHHKNIQNLITGKESKLGKKSRLN